MTAKMFIDTNVFVYSMDSREPMKQEIARSLIRKSEYAAISTQVMQEFYNAMTKKVKVPPLEVRRLMTIFESFETIPTTPDMIIEAINLHILEQLQFWDALILTAAKNANCSQIISEDLNNGQIINGIKIVNPFLVH